MSSIKSIIKKLFAATAVATAFLAPAHATQFDVSDVAISTPGGGYGVDAQENSGTLLNVVFDASLFTGAQFTLAAAGDFELFKVGTIKFAETDAGTLNNKGIRSQEQDGLGVVVSFTFSGQGFTNQTLSTVGQATAGLIKDVNGNDIIVDYALSFDSINVLFGNTGLYSLALNPLSFTASGSTRNLFATVTLLNVDVEEGNPNGNVPEPGSVALLGLAALGLAIARRRKQA